MPLALDELRRRVNVDEPDYRQLAGSLGAEEVPQLVLLARERDSGVASKATYVLGLLPGPEAVEGLAAAAGSDDVHVRLAAAAGFGRKAAPAAAGGDAAAEGLRRLMADPDPGVRKVALRAARNVRRGELREAIEHLAVNDPEHRLRRAAREALDELR